MCDATYVKRYAVVWKRVTWFYATGLLGLLLVLMPVPSAQAYFFDFDFGLPEDMSEVDRKLLEAIVSSSSSSLEDAKAAIKEGANPNLTIYEMPLSLFAISSENPDMLAVLLDAGAESNATVGEGDGKVSLLCGVASLGKPEMVNVLLKHGADIYYRQPTTGMTALSAAAQIGNLEIANLLLAADTEKKYDATETLTYAATGGNVKLIQTLLKAGADVNTTDAKGNTALLNAAANKHAEAIAVLLKAGAEVNVPLADGGTPLILAAENGDLKTVELLLKAGADVNTADTEGDTALTVAASNEHAEVIAALLKAGADVNAQTSAGDTALIFASSYGDAASVRALIKAGAKVNLPGQYQDTALMLAAKDGETDTVKLLLKAGAAVDLRNVAAYTALIIAAQNGHAEIVDLLLKAGAEVNAVTDTGNTALLEAASSGDVPTVRSLLMAGADPNATNNDGEVPLARAMKGSHVDAIRILSRVTTSRPVNADATEKIFDAIDAKDYEEIERLILVGADVNAVTEIELTRPSEDGGDPILWDVQNFTPLMLAAIINDKRSVEILLKAGADTSPQNSDGFTVHGYAESKEGITPLLTLYEGLLPNATQEQKNASLNLAAQQGNLAQVKAAVAAGAQLDDVDTASSALVTAAYEGHIEVMDYLLANGVDVDAREYRDGRLPPLVLAVQNNQVDAVKFLLAHGADVTLFGFDHGMYDSLQIAPITGNVEMVKLLLKAGAPIDAKPGKLHGTALDTAVKYGQVEIIEVLLEAGFALEVKTLYHNEDADADVTLLHLMASKGDLARSKKLLLQGADANALSSKDQTPLMFACKSGNIEVVKLLLKAGADPNLRDSENNAAFSYASSPEVRNLLLDY